MNEFWTTSPDLKLSPRAQSRMAFVDNIMSTTKGRVCAASVAAGLLLGGAFVLKEKLKSTEPVSQIPRAASIPQLPNN
jgi:hypothetical protein